MSETTIFETLQAVDDALAPRVASTLGADELRDVADDRLIEVLALAARIMRRTEAVIIEATGHLQRRSSTPAVAERATTAAGCRSMRELLQRSTGVSGRTAQRYERATTAVRREVAISTGELLPADYPRLREALAAGTIGLDGLEGAHTPLSAAGARLSTDARLLADADLAAHANGEHAEDSNGVDALGAHDLDPNTALPPTSPAGPLGCGADGLRDRARLLALILDPDGAEPREDAALRKRSLTLGPELDGLVSIRGRLLPETAAQLRTLFDAFLNPKVDPVRFRPAPGGEAVILHHAPLASDGVHALTSEHAGDAAVTRDASHDGDAASLGDDAAFLGTDARTRPQLMHDAFTGILGIAANHDEAPCLGGSAPTLVVSVRAEDLREGRGWAHLEGVDEPASPSLARHIACTGRLQRVLQGDDGRVLGLAVHDRVFNAHQRRAILLRDGGCIIPGCRVPASWCELHHVDEFARGGQTHIDNGVALCWFHHRTLDSNGWDVRMREGRPEVRAPGHWDPSGRWRRVIGGRSSRTRPPPRE